jgi:molybdenum cofactor biosynthesis protein B
LSEFNRSYDMGTKEHRESAPKFIKIGIITLSSTRTLPDDKSGHWIKKNAIREGFSVILHQIIPDDSSMISQAVVETIAEYQPDALLLTGGTGISPKDVTIEAVTPLFNKVITSFGTLFAQLSYEEIDSAAILSRATAGVIGGTIVFAMPGSLAACKMACKTLIFPELGHMVAHMRE